VEFLRLELRSQHGDLISDNFYWHSSGFNDQHYLSRLPHLPLKMQLTSETLKDRQQLRLHLANPGHQVALMIQMTPVGADGKRILPAYASDNFISLMPGEERTVAIDIGRDIVGGPAAVRVEGWNVDQVLVH
jgi:hypothetical protein